MLALLLSAASGEPVTLDLPPALNMVSTIAAFPLASGLAIFLVLFLRERARVEASDAARIADAKAHGKEKEETAQRVAAEREAAARACAAELAKAEERLREVERAHAQEMALERQARSADAKAFVDRVLENQADTNEAVAKLDAVLDALTRDPPRRRG